MRFSQVKTHSAFRHAGDSCSLGYSDPSVRGLVDGLILAAGNDLQKRSLDLLAGNQSSKTSGGGGEYCKLCTTGRDPSGRPLQSRTATDGLGIESGTILNPYRVSI